MNAEIPRETGINYRGVDPRRVLRGWRIATAIAAAVGSYAGYELTQPSTNPESQRYDALYQQVSSLKKTTVYRWKYWIQLYGICLFFSRD